MSLLLYILLVCCCKNNLLLLLLVDDVLVVITYYNNIYHNFAHSTAITTTFLTYLELPQLSLMAVALEEYKEDDKPSTRHRRNSFSSDRQALGEQTSERIIFSSPTVQSLSDKKHTNSSIPLNSFNDMGHLSRRVFNDAGGDNHLTSDDFENSFGYRKMFDNKNDVTAITATTVASCVAKLVWKLITVGETMSDEDGHINGAEYDVFCG